MLMLYLSLIHSLLLPISYLLGSHLILLYLHYYSYFLYKLVLSILKVSYKGLNINSIIYFHNLLWVIMILKVTLYQMIFLLKLFYEDLISAIDSFINLSSASSSVSSSILLCGSLVWMMSPFKSESCWK